MTTTARKEPDPVGKLTCMRIALLSVSICFQIDFAIKPPELAAVYRSRLTLSSYF